MTNRYRFVVIILALASLVFLPACGAAATPAQPTIDPNTIYTQAVQTVQAGLSQTAAAAPTNTATPEPTATTEPTSTPVPPTATPEGTQPTLPSAATAKPQAPVSSGGCQTGQTGEHACYGSQGPADNSHFNGAVNVKVFFSLVNTGSTTWNKNYKLVFIGGTQLSGQVSVPLDRDVAPGGKGEFYTTLITPTKDGKYTSHWALINSSGQRVPGGEVYLTFIIP